MFDAANERDRRFDGYGPREIPDALDSEVERYVRRLRDQGPTRVAESIADATEHGRQVLRAYAERMASLSARDGEKDLLLDAVVANVVGGLSTKTRESLMVMAPIEDAAKRIGVELPELFELAAAIVGQPGSLSLVQWLSRPMADRTLVSMGFSWQPGPQEARYISTLGPVSGSEGRISLRPDESPAPSSKVTVVLSKEEALMLSDWLARVVELGAVTFKNELERTVLRKFQSTLEPVVAEPLDPA